MLVINTYLNRHFPGGGQRGMGVAVTAYNRLLAAHVRAYNAIHDLFERGRMDPAAGDDEHVLQRCLLVGENASRSALRS